MESILPDIENLGMLILFRPVEVFNKLSGLILYTTGTGGSGGLGYNNEKIHY